jgi:hypothetical protein
VSILFCCVVASLAAEAGPPSVAEELKVDDVWAGHCVNFCLLTRPPHQWAGYYDPERRMTVAHRMLGEKQWDRVKLPESVGWDTHNYVTVAVDGDGFIHVSGNMHVNPLVYFRSANPYDIQSLARAPMTGAREEKCTYPEFMRGPGGQFIFTYRDGGSGNGDQIYNVYDLPSKTWRRLMDAPLTSGEGKMNAYLNGPALGPDGRYHLCWVWRDNAGCESNHDLCYARSADLVHWETSAGKPLTLPITLATAEVVDPVPIKGGMLNGNTQLGFDSQKRPVISYHKFDAAGNTQIYNARLEDGAWQIHQATEWTYRWDFSGGGSIASEIALSGVSLHSNGSLTQSYRHDKYGSGTWLLDETTLKPAGALEQPPAYPKQMTVPESDFPGIEIMRAGDLGESGEHNVSYVLQWEALGSNRDQPREGPLPGPSPLRVFKLAQVQ